MVCLPEGRNFSNSLTSVIKALAPWVVAVVSPLDLRGPGSLGSSHNSLVVSRKDCLVLPASFQLSVSRGNVA